jgi:hypothetical protein
MLPRIIIMIQDLFSTNENFTSGYFSNFCLISKFKIILNS